MVERVSVDIAKMHVVRAPVILYALGLGSCVSVAMYDSVLHIGGMLHVLLPSSGGYDLRDHTSTKFADSGIRTMYDAMLAAGAQRDRIRAKIAGGAAMFAPTPGEVTMGQRNVTQCKKALSELGIAILAEDTGGNAGRSVIFYTDTGMMKVKTIAHGEIMI